MVLASRIVVSLLGVLGAIQAGLHSDLRDRFGSPSSYLALGILALLVFAVGWLAGGLVGKGLQRGFKRVERTLQPRSAAELSVGALGLIVGLLVAALLYFPVHSLPYIGNWVLLPLFLLVGYLFAVNAAKKHRGFLRLVGIQVLDGEGGRGASSSTLVDTSAIIDGRIADIVRSGFLAGDLVVPQFVLRELQHVADSGDPLRRARGRRGLEVVQELRGQASVHTPDEDFPDLGDVDAKLLKLAQKHGWAILTTDFNLNRLARIQDVRVLNVNELANALKPALLPGERFDVRLVREGKEPDQGVGYLDDGTMVVVEGGRTLVGSTIGVLVTSVLQSPSGKMIFTRVAEGDGAA
jgi:uncharacterized protein YacL